MLETPFLKSCFLHVQGNIPQNSAIHVGEEICKYKTAQTDTNNFDLRHLVICYTSEVEIQLGPSRTHYGASSYPIDTGCCPRHSRQFPRLP